MSDPSGHSDDIVSLIQECDSQAAPLSPHRSLKATSRVQPTAHKMAENLQHKQHAVHVR
jgi:hypothetical protein